MNTDVWPEAEAALLRQQLLLEARKWNLLHQPPATIEDWLVYRGELKAELTRLAGTFPEPGELDVRVHGTLKQDGYRIDNVSYRSRENLRVTANLYVPAGDGPFPAILGTHGHWPQGKVSERVAARGHTFAKEGFVVLIVDAFGAGERGTEAGEYEYHGAQIGGALMSLGETLLGMQVHDNMRGIDLLQGLPCVDPGRIGVTGASGGGNQTMWLAAFDERVKAAVPVVSVGSFRSYMCNANCICETLPEGMTLTEEWAILALAAPCATLVLNALRDGNAAFSVTEMVRTVEGARQVYNLLDRAEHLAYKAIDLPHGYWPEMRRHALGWFRFWLQGAGTGWPCAIPEIPVLPETDLLCFPDGNRPEGVRSIIEFASLRGAELKSALLNPAPDNGLDADEKREGLEEILKLRDSSIAVLPGPVVSSSVDGVIVEKFSVDVSPGAPLPCIRLLPDGEQNPQRVAIVVHPGGKAAAADQPAVRARLAQGTSVCLADLRNLGELRWDRETTRRDHEAARTALWLGRTMIGEWTEDLMALIGIYRAAEMEIELVAWGEPALAALAAAALTDSIAAVTVLELLSTYVLGDGAHVQRMSIFLPGVLAWGDVSLLAALAPCPLNVRRLQTPDGRPLTEQETSDWAHEARGLARRMGCDLELEADVS